MTDVGLLLAIRWLHLLAAATWVGGMVFLALVLVPLLRRLPEPSVRVGLLSATGRRFRAVGWLAIALLVVTGTATLVLTSRPIGPLLATKLALVALMLVLAALHDFVLGPRWVRQRSSASVGAAAAAGGSRAVAWLARLTLLLALVVLLLGLALRSAL